MLRLNLEAVTPELMEKKRDEVLADDYKGLKGSGLKGSEAKRLKGEEAKRGG